MTIKLEDIKVGDLLFCKRTTSAGALGMLNINKDMEYSGVVEDIRPSGLIVLDTPATVRIKYVTRKGVSK